MGHLHLHFNDVAVGDSLITECGNWSYEENPTTTFEVWFTDTFVEDGIYEFSLGTGADDFSLIIRRDLIFGPVDQSGFMIENAMMSQNIVARGFFNVIDSEPNQVTNAFIQLEHWNTPDQMMRIVLELQNEDVVGDPTGVCSSLSEELNTIAIVTELKSQFCSALSVNSLPFQSRRPHSCHSLCLQPCGFLPVVQDVVQRGLACSKSRKVQLPEVSC